MTGTNPVGAFGQTISAGAGVQTPTTMFAQNDANWAVASRSVDNFAPRPASTPAMSVVVDPGFIEKVMPSGQIVVTELAAQTVVIATAPGTPNSRIDLVVVDAGTGVASVVAGSPATSPTAPSVPAGKLKVALVAVATGATSIVNANITDVRAVWGNAFPDVPWAVGSGTGQAITASFTPANSSLVDGLVLSVRAPGANTAAAPTFSADGLTAEPITKFGGTALVAGDIAGQNHELLLRYNLAQTRWELLNPAIQNFTLTSAEIVTALGFTPMGLANKQNFNTSGTWNKPSTGTFALVEIWGAGSGGILDQFTRYYANGGAGGVGGGYTAVLCLLSDLASTVTVTISSGGAPNSVNYDTTLNFYSPGNTSFGSYLVHSGGVPFATPGTLVSSAGLSWMALGSYDLPGGPFSGCSGSGNAGDGSLGAVFGGASGANTGANGSAGAQPGGGGGFGSSGSSYGGAGKVAVTVF